MKKSTRFSFTIAMFLITINSFAANFYWVNGSGNWSDTSHWAFSSGGTILHSQWPGGTDNVFFDANSFSTPGQIVTLDQGITNCADMTWTTLPTTFPILYGDSSKTFRIWGSLTIATVIGFNFNGQVIMESITAGKTITTGGTPINFHWTFNGAGGGWTFQDALMGSSVIDFINGTLNTNNQTINASAFYSTSGGARTMIMGSSIFNLKGFNNALWNINPLGMNLNAGTSTINGTSTIGSVGNFYGGGLTYYNLSFADSAAIFGNNTFHDVAFVSDGFISGNNTFHDVSFFLHAIINGNNTFNNVIMSGNGSISGNNIFNNLTFTPWWTYTLQADATQTIGNICAQGTGALPIRIQSSIAGMPAIISKASGSICWDYVRVSDITATGGAIFNAGLAPTNSQDLGGNTGLLFTGGCTAMSCLLSCNPPSITMQPSNSSVCIGSNAVFSITAEGIDLTYQWQVNQGLGFINLNNIAPYSGVTSNTLNITAPAIIFNGYQYRCAAVGACPIVSMSNAATLTVKSSPTVTVNSAIICSGQTAILTATSGTVFVPVAPLLPPSPPLPPPPVTTNYLWSTGETTDSISVAPATTTTYTVTATTNGCSGNVIATVTVNPVPIVTALVSSSTVTVSATGGTPPYIGTGIFTGLAAGTYTYTVTDANGCEGYTTVTVTEPESNCATAIPFNINSCIYNNALTGNEMWFSFIAGSTNIDVRLFDHSLAHHIGSIDWYEGSCTALISRGSASEGIDSTISFTADSLTNGNTYFIRIVRSSTCNSCTESLNFDLCLQTLLTYVCNPVADIPCGNLIQNPGFELGTTPPVMFGGIGENYVDCWAACGPSHDNTPDVMDIAANTNPPSSNFVNCYQQATGGVGIPYNYYSNGQVNNRTIGSTRYACMFDAEGITGAIFPAPLNKTYYIEFYTATSTCYTAYPAYTNFSIGSFNLNITIPGSTNFTPADMGVWHRNSLCVYLEDEDVSNISQFCLTYHSNINNNTRYFFDDFKMVPLADAGPPATICSGESVPLGPACPIDEPTITYEWYPANSGLSCYNCPNPIASPASTTTYYVTVGGGGIDCSGAVDQVVITVNPLPIVTITAIPFPVCSGSSITLTASPSGATYLWSGGQTTQSITFSPIQSLNYSVTVTNSNGCSKTKQIPINVKPLPIITVNSPTVCSGQPAILTASGATTYSWSPGGSTTNPLIVSPAASTTYSVTGTGANGCSNTAVATVTVNPTPTITAITASPNTLTPPATSNLSATATGGSGITYFWSWSGGIGLPGQNITVSPITTTTYTVTATNLNGCSATATVIVTVSCQPCNAIIYNLSPTSGITNLSAITGVGVVAWANKNIAIAGTLNIDKNFTMDGCNLVMATNAKIIIQNGKTLNLSRKTHIFSCSSMWDGIYVPNGATFVSTKDVFIEDAIHALVSQTNNTTYGGILNVNRTIFNRNLTAIEVQKSNLTTPGLVSISECVFTSRCILSDPTPSNNLAVADYWSNILNYPTKELKAPYTQIKGQNGIKATDVKKLIIGVTNAATDFNGFDAIMCGIKLFRTNATIYNNKFQYLKGYSVLPNPTPPHDDGYGISAIGVANTSYSITVGGISTNQANNFFNTYTAISVSQYNTNNITGNSINNTETAITSFNYGFYGIKVLNSSLNNNTINISNQTLIKNCHTGIFVNRSNIINPPQAQTVSVLKINNNYDPANNLVSVITADPPSVNCPNCHCTYGIYVTEGIVNPTPTSIWQIKTNTITEAANAIYLLNVKRPLNSNGISSVTDNICGVRYSNTGNTNGIIAKGCRGLRLTLNHTKCNSMAAAVFPTGNNLTYGIYLENSNNMLVKCNKMDDAARSLVFQGACTSALITNNNPTRGITQNTMSRAQDGFVILSTGIIGTQGSSAVASNNYWDAPSNYSHSQTFTDIIGANTNSKLFMNSALFPTLNLSSFFGQQYVFTTVSNSSSGNPINCVAVRAMSNNPPDVASTTTYSDELTAMEEDTTQLPVYSNESHWMRKHFVYDELKNDSSLNNNSSLQNFYNSSNHNYAKLAKVEGKIAGGQYNAANAINNSIVTSNVIESNQQTVNALILQELITSGYVYTASDTATLTAIANQCPLAGGYAVYQARNLLMTFAENVIEFIDNCDEAPKRSMNITNTNTDDVNKNFKLYPNPNNGNMMLDYVLNATDKGKILIYDIAGKLIYKYELDASASQIIINHEGFNNGIYFYQIKVNDKMVQSDKLLIIK